MTFKNPLDARDLQNSPAKLRELVEEFGRISLALGVDPVITRVWGKIEGDSGVHAAKRAADGRNEFTDEHGQRYNLYSPAHVEDIVSHLNACFPRNDGKKVCIHHSFQGMPYHFHLQIPISWVTHEELITIYGMGEDEVH